MKHRLTILSAGIALCLTACKAQHKTASGSGTDNKDGWTVLFDGKTFNGWHTYGKTSVTSAWTVQDGTIHLDAATRENSKNRAGGDLVTDGVFDNFDLQLEWKISKGGNSGIIFYVQDDYNKYKATYLTGPEMQVLDNIDAGDNKKENHLAGSLYDLIGSAQNSKPKPVGEWNQAEIKCVNGKLELYLNGVQTAATTLWDDNWKQMVANSKFKSWPDFAKFTSGHIALQDHGGEVAYRNIRIKKL